LKEQNDEHSIDHGNFFRYRQGVGETLRKEKVERRDQGLIMAIRSVEIERLSPDSMHAAHALNGPTIAHSIVTTSELIAALPHD